MPFGWLLLVWAAKKSAKNPNWLDDRGWHDAKRGQASFAAIRGS